MTTRDNESFQIEVQEHPPGIPVLTVIGYLGHEGGQALQARVEALLRQGRIHLVIDFDRCTVLNSPGVGRLMDLLLIIVDDFRGKLFLTGLDAIKQRTLDMAGILDLTTQAPDVAQAVRLASHAR